MVTIGIRELRQHASRHVRMAKEGRRVAVTERGTLVAYLVPTDEPASARARLEAAGAYRPAVGSLLAVPVRGDTGPSPCQSERTGCGWAGVWTTARTR